MCSFVFPYHFNVRDALSCVWFLFFLGLQVVMLPCPEKHGYCETCLRKWILTQLVPRCYKCPLEVAASNSWARWRVMVGVCKSWDSCRRRLEKRGPTAAYVFLVLLCGLGRPYHGFWPLLSVTLKRNGLEIFKSSPLKGGQLALMASNF